MKIDLVVKRSETVEIPDDELLGLAAKIRDKWSMEDGKAVHAEDLVNEAIAAGLLDLPDGWEAPDQEWTDADLKKAMAGGKRRASRKK